MRLRPRFFFFYLWVSICSICWKFCLLKGYIFSIESLLHFCQMSVGHIHVGLFCFLISMCCQICMPVPPLIPYSFDKCSFIVSLKMEATESFYSFKIVWTILVPLSFHLNLGIILSISTKILAGVLIGIVLNCMSIWEKLTSLLYWI